MATRNPLKSFNNRPQQSRRGDEITNITTERIARLPRSDGTMHEIVMETRETVPDQSGTLVDRQTTHIHTDISGRVIPDDPRSVIALSHTGASICSEEEFAICTSRLHPRNRPVNILVGYDGELLPDGARCSYCQRIYNWILFACAGAGLVFLLALYKAAGFY